MDIESESSCHLCDKNKSWFRASVDLSRIFHANGRRFGFFFGKNLCTECLRPRQMKEHRYVCYDNYLCPVASNTVENKVHVLLCVAIVMSIIHFLVHIAMTLAATRILCLYFPAHSPSPHPLLPLIWAAMSSRKSIEIGKACTWKALNVCKSLKN